MIISLSLVRDQLSPSPHKDLSILPWFYHDAHSHLIMEIQKRKQCFFPCTKGAIQGRYLLILSPNNLVNLFPVFCLKENAQGLPAWPSFILPRGASFVFTERKPASQGTKRTFTSTTNEYHLMRTF